MYMQASIFLFSFQLFLTVRYFYTHVEKSHNMNVLDIRFFKIDN